jgi:glyoxylase-like metal-dependent hydrolase (beta-lactamase superfamily II)
MKNRFMVAVFLLVGAVAIGAPAGAQAQSQPQIPEIVVHRLSARSAVFNVGSRDGAVAVLALATQKGMVVVDAPINMDIAKAVRNAIQAEFKRSDFAYLINSHGHGDHTGGNGAYADLPIVGHEWDRARMLNEIAFMRTYFLKNDPTILDTPQFALYEKAMPKTIEPLKFAQNEESMKRVVARYRGGLVTVPPTITFDSHLTLNLGDMTVRLIYYGQAHSPSDTIISVPEENLAVTGSLFIPGVIPILGVRGNPVDTGMAAAPSMPPKQVVDNWLVVLRMLIGEANESTRFIPCHGNVLMNKAEFQQFLSYLEKLWSEVRRMKAEGKTLEEAKAALALKERFPEAADLRDEFARGTAYETLGIHRYNIEFLWKTLDK